MTEHRIIYVPMCNPAGNFVNELEDVGVLVGTRPKKQDFVPHPATPTVFVLDEVQRSFHVPDFWKDFMNKLTHMPRNWLFLMLCTSMVGSMVGPSAYSTTGFGDARVEMDMCLTKEECFEFLGMYRNLLDTVRDESGQPRPFSDCRNLLDAMVNDSGGRIGALRITLDSIQTKFHSTICTEGDLLQYYRSLGALQNSVDALNRCC